MARGAGRTDKAGEAGKMWGKLFKLLLALIVIGAIALVGFAYLGDLDPELERVTEPVELELSG
jgi:hypothetical protein